MTAGPLVTIMIPTYNQAAYLEDAVRSALKQNYDNLEVIISDDSSSDNTPEIAGQFADDKRLKYFRQETTLGKTANYRRCLYDLAHGEWVLNLDGDDYLTDEQYISFAMRQIRRNDNVVLFAAGKKNVLQRRFRSSYLHRLVEQQTCMAGINLFLNWHRYKIPHLTSLYHRPTACRIGFYDIDISSTDWESLLRLVLHGNVILSEKIVGVWRGHNGNLSQSMDFSQFDSNFAFITKPLEYALSKGYEKSVLEAWKKNMMNSVMRGQFNEVWINVMRKRDLAEMIRFVETVKKEKPEFVNNFYQPKNVARLSFYLFLTALAGMRSALQAGRER